MGILDELQAHQTLDLERDLALGNAERDRDSFKQQLTDERVSHAVTTSRLDQANAEITTKDAELALLRDRIAFCEDNHHPDEPAPDLPLRTPLSALALHSGYGVCQHVNFQTTIYKHQAEILERYGAMHIGEMRSLYAHTLSNFSTAVAAARQHGVKWHATVAAMDSTEAQVRGRIAHMAANTADVIKSIEGVNEPNGDGYDQAKAARTALIQWWIWDEVRKYPSLDHVVVYSCSMHDVNLDNADGAHWAMFANAVVTVGGVTKGRGRDFCHGGAVHGYQAGKPPGQDAKLKQRLSWCRDALGGKPVKVTEMGWTNTTGPKASRVGGAKVTSERASAAYDVQALFVYGWLGIPFLRYEFLDDPNGTKTQTEANFGLWEVVSVEGDPDLTWTPKPVVAPLTAALGWLEDPGAPYSPTQAGLEVVGDVDWQLVQKRDGSTRVYLWNPEPVWDPIAEVDLTPAPAEVKVTDAQGLRTFVVGAQPVPVDVRN